MAVRRSFSVEDGNLSNTSLVGSRKQSFSDIDLSFAKRSNGDIFKKTDLESIKQSVRTLLNTNFGEIPFNYYFGANLRAMLGENFTPDMVQDVKVNVRLALENFEPRVELINTEVYDGSEYNSIGVTVTFRVKNTNENVQVETSFSRLR